MSTAKYNQWSGGRATWLANSQQKSQEASWPGADGGGGQELGCLEVVSWKGGEAEGKE